LSATSASAISRAVIGAVARRCKTRASLPLDAIRRAAGHTPIWKLEAALKCRSCKKGRYAPPVHMIKLTATREITPQPEPVSRDQLPKPPRQRILFHRTGSG
jgi:hypothetical protein